LYWLVEVQARAHDAVTPKTCRRCTLKRVHINNRNIHMARSTLLSNLRSSLLAPALAAALIATAGSLASAPVQAGATTLSGAAPLVIAHRGASGYRPEHTLAAYELAIAQGARYIEPDLVMSKDGELLARHEPMLARVELNTDGSIRRVNGAPVIHRTDTSTNVWQLAQYADRLQVKTLDGVKVAGWWVEDFTAAEIRADVRAQERLRDLRTANNAFNDQFTIPTLQEVINLAKAKSAEMGVTIGIYPETKHPSYFKAITDKNGVMRMEDKLLEVLHSNYGNTADAPVFIQSFEVSNLQYLDTLTQMRIVQLLSSGGRPYDFVLAGDLRGYRDLARADARGLDFLQTYADGIGANTNLMIPLVGGRLGTPTRLVSDAHDRGMVVHGWTFRAENIFLPNDFDIGPNPADFGNMGGQIRAFLALGMDGFFTDHPDLGVAAIPLPGSAALALTALSLLAFTTRRRRQHSAAALLHSVTQGAHTPTPPAVGASWPSGAVRKRHLNRPNYSVKNPPL